MALEGYKCNNHVIYSSKYDVVWTPKYRRPVLVGAVAKRCQALIRQVAAKYDAEIFAVEILSDHVHVLCEVDPQFGIHRLVKNIKAVSSHVLRKEFPTLKSRLPTLWTNSYLVSTVAGAPLAVIQQYVEKQKDF
jgi:putative transposase